LFQNPTMPSRLGRLIAILTVGGGLLAWTKPAKRTFQAFLQQWIKETMQQQRQERRSRQQPGFFSTLSNFMEDSVDSVRTAVLAHRHQSAIILRCLLPCRSCLMRFRRFPSQGFVTCICAGWCPSNMSKARFCILWAVPRLGGPSRHQTLSILTDLDNHESGVFLVCVWLLHAEWLFG